MRELPSLEQTPIDTWEYLLRPEVELEAPFWEELSGRMRDARLLFGGRPLCPFLRPFFLREADEVLVRRVTEAIAAMGERVVRAALENPALFEALRLTPEEERLARIPPGYHTASTASRLDAFLLPDSLRFAEYNAESPAGLGYSETLGRIFADLPMMRRFREVWDTRWFPLMDTLLDALIKSYREWGGRAQPPTILITDWRDVPTWSEFEILRDRFIALGVPTVIADPRDLTFDRGTLRAEGQAIDLVYRRVLIADMLKRPADCAVLLEAYLKRAVCMANTLQCKIPHKKAFFAVLTDDRWASLFSSAEREIIASHVPWTRVVADVRTTHDGTDVDLLPHVREFQEDMVIKPNDEFGGAGVVLGWDVTNTEWNATIDQALEHPREAWVVQARIPIRRERFPVVLEPGKVVMQTMLVDFAPYLFRGKMSGFLTRLSSSGLANVTSGGGQVPAFVVEPRNLGRVPSL